MLGASKGHMHSVEALPDRVKSSRGPSSTGCGMPFEHGLDEQTRELLGMQYKLWAQIEGRSRN